MTSCLKLDLPMPIQRFRVIKLSVLVFLGILFTSVSYLTAQNLAPRYFFDKLYYKKSTTYGYVNGQYPYIDESEKKLVHDRVEDLDLIYNKSSVLGTTADEFKIAIIGDSFTFGVGIKNEDRYAVVLEKRLNEIRPTKIYSLAIGGDDMLEYYTHYKLAEEKIKPDLYIITMVNNDFLIHESPRPGLLDYLSDAMKICGNNVKFEDVTEKSHEWEYYLNTQVLPAASDEFANTCIMRLTLGHLDMNRIVFLPINPLPNDLKSIEVGSEFMRFGSKAEKLLLLKYKNLVLNAGGYILNIDYERIPPEKLLVSEREGHYSKFTNAFIADELFNDISENPKWKFAKFNK